MHQVVEKKGVKRRQSPQKVIKKEEDRDEEEEENGTSPRKNPKSDPEQLKCEFCSIMCSSVSNLQQHTLNEHVTERKPPSSPSQRVCCQQCDETFENFAQFAIHMKSHISSVSQLFYCPICPLGPPFRDKKTQLEHLTTQHLQVQIIQYVCTDCEGIFVSHSSLALHFTETHRKFMCTSCDFVTEQEKVFKDHSKVHSRQIPMFGCGICGNTYTSQNRLINHVQMTHDQEPFYPPALLTPKPSSPSPKPQKGRALQCSVCDETVFGEDGLDEHRLERHCKVRYADKCADCHEPLDTENCFVEHCLRHAKDHAHHCPVCRQSLRSETQIHAHCVYHMRKNEEEEMDNIKKEEDLGIDTFNFVCPICGVKMEDGFALIEHSKSHLQDL